MFMQKKQPKKILKKIAKLHVIFSGGLFVLYLALSLIYSPEFLLSDVRQKFRALADEWIFSEETMLSIFATVLDPPVKPIVTGEAVCSNGNLSVELDWPSDINSESYDIIRAIIPPFEPLALDLIVSQYSDTVVVVNTSYTYIVTAYGPMGPGSAESDPITITTPEECKIILPAPEVQIVSFDGKNIGSYVGTPATINTQPVFSGTTNMANADISLLISSGAVIAADINANAGGYWSWTPPVSLSLGTNILDITATDPLDPLRTVSTEFTFIINEEAETGKDHKDDKKKKTTIILVPSTESQPPTSEVPPSEKVAEIPFEFSLKVAPQSVYQGRELATLIRIERVADQYVGREAIVRYRIFDEKGEQVENILGEIILRSGVIISRNITIPAYFKDGSYRIQAEIIFDKYNISQEKSFFVLPLPILKLGGGFLITYPELLSRLGTASLWLLLCLIIWLLFFSREYWLYLHALRHITEKNLERIGLFGMGKGKGVPR
jgi:hypothetical protein